MRGNPLGAPAKLRFHARVGLGQKPVHRRNHADDLFLRDLQAASDGIGKRVVVLRGCIDEILFPQEQACVLRASYAFASGESNEVEPHLRIVPQIGDRRHIGSRVVKAGDAVLVRHTNPVFARDLPLLRGVKEKRHDRPVVKGSFVVLQGFDLDEADTAIPHRVIVAIAVRLLNDHFVLEAGQIGRNVVYRGSVREGHARGRAQRKRRGRAGGHHGGLTTKLAGQVLAGGLL